MTTQPFVPPQIAGAAVTPTPANDPISKIIIEIGYDDDEDETYAYLYCMNCGLYLVDNVDSIPILGLYLKARQHISDHHTETP